MKNIAIVTSSLENLDRNTDYTDTEIYRNTEMIQKYIIHHCFTEWYYTPLSALKSHCAAGNL